MGGEMMRLKATTSVRRLRLKASRVLSSSPFPGRARRLSATAIILLALWSGGVGCLWCCASDLPKRGCDERSAAKAHHSQPACATRRRCCEPTESNRRAAIKEAPTSAAAHCCPIGAHASGPAIFPSSSSRQALALVAIAPSLPVAKAADTPRFVSDTQPANKGSTYLRCCVFLI
jgi:hypothetical protein